LDNVVKNYQAARLKMKIPHNFWQKKIPWKMADSKHRPILQWMQ